MRFGQNVYLTAVGLIAELDLGGGEPGKSLARSAQACHISF